jgi:chloride channel protein, CIC family
MYRIAIYRGGSSYMEKTKDSLADFSTDTRVLLLAAMAIVIGAIGAIVAWALVWLIAVITNLCFYQKFSALPTTPEGHHLGPWVIAVPMAGALIIGLMARYGSPKIRGHGIPEALEAILLGRSRIEPKVALLKPLSSAISIGTGGPFGAEGPIIMTGGACGSLFAQLFDLSANERKTLLVAGAAAGMAAIFATPVAAVFLAVELLLFEWKPRSLIPVAVAAMVAAALRAPLLGAGPIFAITPHASLGYSAYLCAAGVGLAAGLISSLLTILVYAVEDFFEKIPIHWMWWPVIGALFVGIGGYIDPRVLGVGYGTIHGLLRGDLIGTALISFLIIKSLVWSIALGSGTSGGVLAPLLMMGGVLGALAAPYLPVGDSSLWALVGMSAIMGGTMRSPFTAVIFALELTDDIHALPVLFVGAIVALGVTVLLMRRSILTEKIARHGHHISREYSVDHFELMRVSDAMDDEAQTVPATTLVGELADRIAQNDPSVTLRQAVLILDENGKLAGIITRGDIVRALQGGGAAKTVLEAGQRELIVTHPNEPLRDAIAKMITNHIGRLPVVDPANLRDILGYLGRANIVSARLREHAEEHDREPGVFGRAKAASKA